MSVHKCNHLFRITTTLLALVSLFFSVQTLALDASTTTMQNSSKVTIIEQARFSVLPLYPVLDLVANVDSVYEITSVTATVAGKTIPLAYTTAAWQCSMGSSCAGWRAQVDMSAVQRGTYLVVVTARDATGGVAKATRTITIDPTPGITVTQPLPYAIATPALKVEVECKDDAPNCTLTVRDMAGKELLSGTGAISASVNLQQYLGQTTALTITATDSGGQKAIRTLSIPVVDTTRLTLQASVPGKIVDVSADKILYLDDAAEPQRLVLRNRSTGADTVIYSVADGRPTQGYVHDNGAIFIDQGASSTTTKLYDWRNGSLVNLSNSYQSTGGFMVNGKYATFFNAGSGYPAYPDYYLRDLSSGTNQLIASGVGNNSNSLAADGSVAYWKSYDIYQWRNGVSTQITKGGSALWSVYPVTDGKNIVFKQTTPCCNNQTRKIALWNGSSVTVLADMGSNDPNPPRNYAVANGYVAYTKPGTSGQLQVWRRNPSGADQQLTYFSGSSTVDSLSDSGAVTVLNGGKLYLYEVGGDATELGVGLEQRFWQSTELYGTVGGSVFKINRNAIASPTTSTSTSTSTTSSSTTTSSTTTTTAPTSLVLSLEQGWSLLGNTLNQAISVASLFGDASTINTVWKWDAANAAWQFYTPTLDATALDTYAKSKGYSVLAGIQPGDGFWVNAKTAVNLGAVSGQSYSLAANKLSAGWNLVATANKVTAPAFNLSLTDPLAPPPEAGTIPANLVTLWAWDNPSTKWYFYAPTLEAEGASKLKDYANTKGYLDFVSAGKTLGPGVGFWVNK